MELAEDKDHLAELLREAHRETLHVLDGLDHSHTVYEGWTVKDVIENLLAWETEGLAALQAHSIGSEYEPLDTSSREPVDSEAQRLYAEWEAVRELLRAAIIDMPTDRLLMMVHSPWGAYGHVHKLVGDLIAYQREQVDAIIDSFNQRAS